MVCYWRGTFRRCYRLLCLLQVQFRPAILFSEYSVVWLLSCLHLHLGLLSVPSLSPEEIFHLCYHLPVVFSHYPLVHSKPFQSFQLSFYSLSKVFCVTGIIPEQEWKWMVATCQCEFWNKGSQVEFVQHIRKNLTAKKKPFGKAFMPSELSNKKTSEGK